MAQALKLHQTPSGLQSFAMFKLDRLVPWDPSYLDNVRELMRKRKFYRSGTQPQVGSGFPDRAGKQQ